MSHFVTAEVEEILATREGLQRLKVQRKDDGPGVRAFALTDLVGEVGVGDRVVLNVSAVEAGLGTGGWHVVHWNLARDELLIPGGGNVMKLRYTSLQVDCGVAEEEQVVAGSLDGVPVVGCELLSQAGVVARLAATEAKVALVVLDSAALPLQASDLVHTLRQEGTLRFTVTAGQAFGGDFEAVNLPSALLLARAQGAEIILITQGFGVVGTGSEMGFSGIALVDALAWVQRLGGKPILAVRYSEADGRERHQQMSHHAETVLRYSHDLLVPRPSGSKSFALVGHSEHEVQLPHDLDRYCEGITTMGRRYRDDPEFFRYAASAGVLAAHTLQTS